MAVQKKRKTAAERAKEALPNIQAVEIPIGAVVGALKRLGQVCDYVEAQAKQLKDAERPWPSAPPPYNPDAGAYPAAQANPPQVGAEQQAKSIAEASFRLAAVAAELRDRFLYGGARSTDPRPNGVKETEGPLKDALNATGFHLDCTFGALEDINRYIGS